MKTFQQSLTRMLLVPAFAFLSALGSSAAERDIFDYEGQKGAPDETVKIVFIGDAGTHGARGNHEFLAAFIMIARSLHDAYPNVHAVVRSSKNWPTDLAHADAIVVGLNHGERAGKDEEIGKATKRGAGFMAVHYGVEVKVGVAGRNYTNWLGGYFETEWSVNPWWTPEFKTFPEHPTARGLTPFTLRDEWYYHMRFAEDMKGVTPVLSAAAPIATVREQKSARGGNPDVFKAVSEGQPQHMAWAYERPGGGRGYGFTGMHLHKNHENDSFRTSLMNGAAWVAGLEIPENGVPSKTPTHADLQGYINDAIGAIRDGK